ncbi:MAG TPA: AmiS/UreI family transporter, partial [Candidatus Dormibacteraeota bacterium]|nr:AmiS/UreI family transporter [Candidatus Dormibacteraeota bacterium]
ASVLLAGLIIFYAAFFTLLGVTEILGLDLRPLGNVSAAVALAPLAYWQFFDGGWMFRSILIFWAVTFLCIAATTYGKFQPRALGTILIGTAVYTFWVPAWILATGHTIP